MDNILIVVALFVFIGLIVIMVFNGRKQKKLERENTMMIRSMKESLEQNLSEDLSSDEQVTSR